MDSQAGFSTELVWSRQDLAVILARAGEPSGGPVGSNAVTDADLPADYFNRPLAEVDPEIAEVLALELERQQRTLEMIASENFAPVAVLEAQGSVLNNKYAEGYPGKRYYGGCEFVDIAEQLAIDRAKALFGAEHANVQPHAGAQANTAVYHALLQPGRHADGARARPRRPPLARDEDQRLRAGCTTSSPTTSTARPSLIDMDEVQRLAEEHRPKMIVAGWSAYPRHLDFARFREIADSVGAYLMVDMAHFAGLVAAGLHPSPVPVRRRRHHHHPQDDRRRSRRHDPLPRGATPRRSTRPSSLASRAARSST